MSIEFPQLNDSDPAGLTAAAWVLRHDRGLTAAEQDAFSQWLAADPRHRVAWAEHRWGWDELDRLAGLQTSVHAVPDPDLLAPKRRRPFGFPLSPSLSLSFLAAAALVLGVFLWQQPAVPPSAAPPSLALIERRDLADGSVVELNRGAVVSDRFTPGERRVQLERGEAHFTVAKDAARPFVVEVAGVTVRAVGTAFNVRLDPTAVEVLVTEGKVAVMADDGGRPAAASGRRSAVRGRKAEAGGRSTDSDAERRRQSGRPNTDVSHLTSDVLSLTSDLRPLTSGTLVSAGERTVVSLAPAAPAPAVQALSPAEIEARLAWQPRLLDFTNASLPEILAEFNRRNPVHLTLGDDHLCSLRLSATFRSDNVEGFVRLMTSDFGMRAERRGDTEVVLVQAR